MREYLTDTRGNLSIITAIVSMPLVIATAYAVDFQNNTRHADNMQLALDAAALATVIKGSDLSIESQRSFAEDAFFKNFPKDEGVSLRFMSSDGKVTLEATGTPPAGFAKALGQLNTDISRKSSASLVKGSTTCLLILDPDSEKSLVFRDKAVFDSPNCAVQVNSSNPRALWNDLYVPPSAQDFCVTGGYRGEFAQHVNTDCTPVKDPYAERAVPSPGACVNVPNVTRDFTVSAGQFQSKSIQVRHMTPKLTGRSTVLSPGTYCEGLSLEGDVRLRPGIYHVTDGNLVFGETARITGEDVTFVLSGNDSRLHMKEGAKAKIIASRDGELGGVAFYQVPSGSIQLPESRSLVQTGGNLAINGVFYFPTQHVLIEGDAQIGSFANATSFIAYNLSMNAAVRTRIEVDHMAAGLPPLEPRTDESARLVMSHLF